MQFFVGDTLFRLLRADQKPEAEICLKIKDAEAVLRLYRQISTGESIAPSIRSYDFIPENYDKCRDEILAFFRPIAAAGGIVGDPAGRLLFIKRLGVWDLPKGKVEKGEKNRPAAVREVQEECGISAKIEGKIGSTFHTYVRDGKDYLKETHWFAMSEDGKSRPVAQTEEDISEVRRLSPEEIGPALENTYASVRSIFEKYRQDFC